MYPSLKRLWAALGSQDLKAALNRHSVTAVFVIRTETRRVGAEGWLALRVNLLQRVHSLSIDNIHLKMHDSFFFFLRVMLSPFRFGGTD